MTRTIRILLSLLLVIPAAGPLVAQEQADPAAVTSDAPTGSEQTLEPVDEDPFAETGNSYEVRGAFARLLRQSPPELSTILSLDPTLLSSPAFLDGYPELAAFVSAHPEVQRNPRFFLAEFEPEPHSRSIVGDMLEIAVIFASFLLVTLALAWLVRTIIEQKRWNRLSKTQSETHNKILDRFENNEELLGYIRSPAGQKFLESAPIPLHEVRPSRNPSLSRVLWSIQIGVIVAAGSIGILLVSLQFDEQSALELFAFGVIGLCVGVGFIVSGAVSLFLSKRLGLWSDSEDDGPGRDLQQSGIVR